MPLTTRPCRSVLYIPASRERALEKAQSLAADAIIFDLEDAVAPAEKIAARQTLLNALANLHFGKRLLLIRVNGMDTEWGEGDLAAFAQSQVDGILIPKVDNAQQLDDVSGKIPNQKLWAMMETARGILKAEEIADHPKVDGLVAGTNDLAKELGSTGRDAINYALQKCLLAARAANVICVDGVYNAFKDTEGLRDECQHGLALGFDGKTLIHPAQIDIANEVFAPTEEMINLAGRQIAAFEEAKVEGKGVAVVDGRIVENLHVETAQAILAKSRQIKALETQL